MNNINKSLSINETFIIDSIEGSDVMSACTALYTNNILSCSGNSEIILSNNLISFNTNVLATIISATTYYGDGSQLTGISKTDIYVTGGTYSNGTVVLANNSGGTFTISGFYTGSTDVRVTGGTYSAGTAVFTNNTGGTFSVSGFSTGSSVTQNLQQVTDIGDTTTNSIYITNDDGVLVVQVTDTSSYSALYPTQLNIVQNNGENIIGVYTSGFYFTDNGINKSLSSGSFNNSNSVYNLPDKITGDYILATTSDLSGYTTGQTLQAVTDIGNTTTNSIFSDAGFFTFYEDGNNAIGIDAANGSISGALFRLIPDSGTPSIQGQIYANNLTGLRHYEVPNKDGIIALLSDISGATSGLTLQQVTNIGNSTINDIILSGNNNSISVYNSAGDASTTVANNLILIQDPNGIAQYYSNAFQINDYSTGNSVYVTPTQSQLSLNALTLDYSLITGIIEPIQFFQDKDGTIALLSDISGATSGLTLQQTTDNGNSTDNSIVIYNGPDNLNLIPEGIQINAGSFGVSSSFTVGAIELHDISGAGGYSAWYNDVSSSFIGFNFQNNNFAGSTNLILAPEFFVSGNTFNNYYIPFKSGNGDYTLATIEDLTGFTGNTLQAVTDNGNTTTNSIVRSSPDGLVRIDIGDASISNGITFFDENLYPGAEQGLYGGWAWQIKDNYVNNGSSITAEVDSGNDNIRISFQDESSTLNLKLPQGFGDTYTYFDLFFPNKPSGGYTIATLEDIPSATTQTLQIVTDAGNITNNNILIESGGQAFINRNNDGSNLTYQDNNGFRVLIDSGFYSSILNSQLLGFSENTNGKSFSAGTFSNTNGIYSLPDKVAGTYILATLNDTNIQSVLDNGNTAENQYINLVNAIDNQIVTNLVSYNQILLQDITTSSDVRAINFTPYEAIISSTDNDTGVVKQVSFDRDGVVFVNNNISAVGRISNKNSNENIILNFPDKTTGEYTIATSDDLSTPTLQEITDAGNVTTGSILITSDSNYFAIQDVSGQNTSYILPTGFQNVATSGLYNSFLNSNSLVFNDGNKSKTLSKGTYINTGGIYQLPDKTSGTYTLATTSDLSGFITQDIRVTGGTYSAGTAVFTNNTGGTFSVSGFSTATQFTGGTINSLTSTTISATTYLGLPTDIRVTGGTYSAGTAVFRNNTGGTFNVSGFLTGTTWGNISGVLSGQTDLYNSLTTLSASTDSKISGNGTANFVSKWSGGTGITNSIIYDDGTNISIGATTGTSKVTIETAGITTTTNDTGGILLKNPIGATGAVTQQHSPAIVWDGNAWRSTNSTSQNLKWKLSNNVTAGIGTNVEGKLEFQVNSNNAGWVTTGISLKIDRFGLVALNAPIITGGVLGGLSTLSITKSNSGSPSDGLSVGGASFLTTTGANYGGNFTIGAAPTSGSMVFNSLASQPTINQTGSASGITRGLYVNPTITSAVDFRGVEVTNGSVALPITTGIGSTYSVKNHDYVVNITGGTFTITLPTATTCIGRIYIIKNSGSGTVTLATTSSQTIDGVTTKTMNIQYGVFQVMSDGSNWLIISQI